MLLTQEKTFNLLVEIDEICKKNNIQYVVGPTTTALMRAYGGHSESSINLDVLMPAEEVEKFVICAEKENRVDRELDYMGNYKNHMSFDVEYVDSSTTFLKISNGTDFSKYGVKVTIIPLRKKLSGLKGSFYGVLETGWECNGFKLTKKITLKRMLSISLVRMTMVIGKKNLAKILFKKTMKAYSGFSDVMIIKNPKKKQRGFSREIFKKTTFLEFEGSKFKALKENEMFLENYYGLDWMNITLNKKDNTSGTIVSGVVPYHDYLKTLEKEKFAVSKLFKIKYRNKIKGITTLRYLKSRNRALLLLKRSGDRLYFYEEFQSKREIIYNLYENEEYKELSKIFSKHQWKTLFYLKKGLGFCVNKEYFNIQCQLFVWEGLDDIMEKVIKLIPEEHYKAIVEHKGVDKA